jgi:type IV/VI secretion system ImpK/VasF family protein
MTGAFRGFFLVIAAFHSESTRARLHPGQFHRTLEELLAGADATARSSGVDWNLFQQAKYAVVALADDLALHSDWDHAEQWNRYLLELRHFNTSFAGQEFFERVGRLRQQLAGVQDPTLREQVLGTLEVYYTCLRLGFRGRFRNAPPGELEGTANQILALIWPLGDKGAARRSWGEAYREAPKGKILYRRLVWWWPVPASLAAAVGLWFLLSARQTSRVDGIVKSVGKFEVASESEPDGEK